jgi:hypothetical protein
LDCLIAKLEEDIVKRAKAAASEDGLQTQEEPERCEPETHDWVDILHSVDKAYNFTHKPDNVEINFRWLLFGIKAGVVSYY